MDGLQIEMTPQRKNFLEKFAALLILREHTSLDLRSSQAAMEVILNFHRHPIKQARYPSFPLNLLLLNLSTVTSKLSSGIWKKLYSRLFQATAPIMIIINPLPVPPGTARDTVPRDFILLWSTMQSLSRWPHNWCVFVYLSHCSRLKK